MKAVGHRLHLKKLGIAKRSAGDIIVVSDDKVKPEERAQQYCVVTDIGPDAFQGFSFYQDGKPVNGKPWCEVGDIVYIQRYSGHVTYDLDDGEEYLISNDVDVLCVVKKANEYGEVPELVLTIDGVRFK